ncbi:MAG: hypothetical protein ACR2IK_17880 [Chloroflexota bacterium]
MPPIALLFALAARLPYFVGSDFPLNDGGLFAVMAQDLFANHFALPAFTSYNSDSIPFAYPPGAFYAVAALHALMGFDVIAVERWLPLFADLASVVAVTALARATLRGAWAVALAPIIFALLPRSYEWMIMGGGVTRALGYVLALACIVQAVHVARSPSTWRTVVCALLAALALITHLEEGLFALYSLALVLACYGRNLRSLAVCAAVGAGAAVLSAPWWVSVMLQHGFAPFQSASMTSGWSTPGTVLAALGEFVVPPSLPLGLVGGLGLFGGTVCLLRGEVFLPLWLPMIFLLTPRSAPSQGVVPLALLASVALADLIVPPLATMARGTHAWAPLGRLVARGSREWVRTPGARLVVASLGLLVVLAGVYRVWPRMSLDRYSLTSLGPGERQAMAWLASNTPTDERFLVLFSTWSWEEDQSGEWFPVLANRQSVLTPQGAEWLPDRLHARKVCLFQKVRDAAVGQNGLGDLDAWASDRGVVFSAIYVSKAARGPIDWSSVVASASTSPNYTVLLDTPDAVVVQRNLPVAPRWTGSGQFVIAEDCRSLGDEDPQVQADFTGRFGDRAALAWVAEHEQELPARPSMSRLLVQSVNSLVRPRS